MSNLWQKTGMGVARLFPIMLALAILSSILYFAGLGHMFLSFPMSQISYIQGSCSQEKGANSPLVLDLCMTYMSSGPLRHIPENKDLDSNFNHFATSMPMLHKNPIVLNIHHINLQTNIYLLLLYPKPIKHTEYDINANLFVHAQIQLLYINRSFLKFCR